VPLLALQILVYLVGRLAQEEEAAENQDQVASGYLLREDRKQRGRKPDDPAQRQEQEDAHDERQPEPEPPGERLPLLRQLVHEDRDKDHIVYTEHDLEG
jgi:hypothetical protein